jgi:hypothetical protein
MKIISRVRPFDHHHEKIAAIVKITIAHRRLEEMAVLFDPICKIDRRLHGGRNAQIGRRCGSGNSDDAAYLRPRTASTIAARTSSTYNFS